MLPAPSRRRQLRFGRFRLGQFGDDGRAQFTGPDGDVGEQGGPEAVGALGGPLDEESGDAGAVDHRLMVAADDACVTDGTDAVDAR